MSTPEEKEKFDQLFSSFLSSLGDITSGTEEVCKRISQGLIPQAAQAEALKNSLAQDLTGLLNKIKSYETQAYQAFGRYDDVHVQAFTKLAQETETKLASQFTKTAEAFIDDFVLDAKLGRTLAVQTIATVGGTAYDLYKGSDALMQAWFLHEYDALGNFTFESIGGILGCIMGGWLVTALYNAAVISAMTGFLPGVIVASCMGLGILIMGEVYQSVSQNFTTAQRYVVPIIRRSDPLTLDLDNDGIETVAANTANPILFDHDGDGIKNGTGWVAPDDGFLGPGLGVKSAVDPYSYLKNSSIPANVF